MNIRLGCEAYNILYQERKDWELNHPEGFHARPLMLEHYRERYSIWECAIPGLPGTPWEGGLYRVQLSFSEGYPYCPPLCKFVQPVFHPNIVNSHLFIVFALGRRYSVKELLLTLQQLLNAPLIDYGCPGTEKYNEDARNMYCNQRENYDQVIREQAQKYSADEVEMEVGVELPSIDL